MQTQKLLCRLLFCTCLLGFWQLPAQTWQLQVSQTSRDLHTLFFVNDSMGWVMGESSGGSAAGTIRHTQDQGLQWNSQILGQTNADITASFFWNEQQGLAVGRHSPGQEHSLLIRTQDGGNNWQIALAGAPEWMDVHFADSQTGLVVGEEGAIAKSSDGGMTWTSLSSASDEDWFGVISLSSQKAIVVGEEGRAQLTTNGGNQWQSVSTASDEDLFAITFSSPLQGWIVGAEGTILHSSDGGFNWQNQHSGTERDLKAISMLDDLNGWVAGEKGVVLRTQDGGNSWQAENSQTERDIYDLWMQSDSLGWFCGKEGVLHIYQPGPSTPPISPLSAAFQVVQVSCAQQAVVFEDLSQGNPISWNWNFGDGQGDTAQHPTHLYTQPGLYLAQLIVVDSLGNQDTANHQIQVLPPAPVALIGNLDTSICLGDTLHLGHQSQGIYQLIEWQTGDGNLATQDSFSHQYWQSGTYLLQLILSHSGICRDTATQVITVSQTAIQLSPLAPTICGPGDSIILAAAGASTYQWSPTVGLSDTTSSQVYAFPDSQITYQVIGTDGQGCMDTAQTTVFLDALSAPIATFHPSDTLSCGPASIAFQNQSLFAQAYRWYFPGGQPDSSQTLHPQISYSQAGTYDVSLIAVGCQSSDTLLVQGMISIGEAVQAAFLPSVDTLILSQDSVVGFTNNSSQANQWWWDFGNGDTSDQENPSSLYSMAGAYQVMLIASNGACSDTVIQQLVVLDSAQMRGIPPVAAHPQVLIAPNPCRQRSLIRVNSPETGTYSLVLRDLTTSILWEAPQQASPVFPFDRTTLADGLYILEVFQGDRWLTSTKILLSAE